MMITIKFIRYGQYFIEKNGEGVLAYISIIALLMGLPSVEMRARMYLKQRLTISLITWKY